MPSITPNLRLSITNRETNKPFLNWRLGIDGPDDSNMIKLDTAWGNMKTMVDGAMAAVGHAYTAATVADMTDHDKAYVYLGSETGYTAGNWYYWNEDQSAWVSGGVYNATALQTDDTLTLEGEAADAKSTGEMIVINGNSSNGTRINITTTDEDVVIPTMDDIDDIETQLENYDGIIDTAITAQPGKQFIAQNGNIVPASGNYHISEPIAVTAGQDLHLICTLATGMSAISLCDANTQNIVPVVFSNADGAQHEYEYPVQEDGYVVLSYRYDQYYKLYTLTSLSNLQIKGIADSNRTIIKDQCGAEKIEFVYVNGKRYIDNTGTINTASGTFHISKPIPVSRNDMVIFVATGAIANPVISLCDANSENITPVVYSNSDGLEHDYTTDIVKDGYIILSYNYSNRADLYIVKDFANKRIVEYINNTIQEEGNVFNHRTLIDKTVINTSGVLTENVQYATTQEIPVEPSTVYSHRNIHRIAYYNDSGNYIGRSDIYNTPGTITTPATAAYMRASVIKYNSAVGVTYDTTDWQIVKGDTLPDYEPQYITVDGYRITDRAPNVESKIASFRRWDKICYDKEEVFLVSNESEAVTSSDSTTSAIISKYDALMASNDDYITKTALGTASDGTTTIYQYDFDVPGAVLYAGSRPVSTNAKTKIILISGVHPEFGGIYGLYNAMREITTNPDLSAIKNGVHFIVIPTVNPYGIDTKNRKNANGVDLARNFEIDFQPGSDTSSPTYGGTEPLSEPESQIVNAVMTANKDAIMFASCHSFQKDSNSRVMWGSCGTMYTTNIVSKLIVKMSAAWREKYTSIIPQTIDTILGTVGISTETGSEGKQAAKYGIQGLTLETSDYFPYNSDTALTAFAISRNSETYINFIKTTLGLWEASDAKNLNIIGMN